MTEENTKYLFFKKTCKLGKINKHKTEINVIVQQNKIVKLISKSQNSFINYFKEWAA